MASNTGCCNTLIVRLSVLRCSQCLAGTFLFACVLLSGCGFSRLAGTPQPVAIPSIWVGAWGDAITNADATADNQGGTDRSFRFLVIPTIGGTRERVRFSNFYATGPVTLGAARLSIGTDGSPGVDPAHDVALSFNGQPSVVLSPGQVVTSDAVDLTFSFGQTLAVSVFLKNAFGPLDRHNANFINNFSTANAAGDKTTELTGTSYTATLDDWLVVNGIDVYGPYQGTLALFGSSTTDGFKANYSSDKVYPTPNTPVPGQHTSRLSDWMAQRLNAAGYRVGVVNLGIPGDTVTADITNTTNDVKNANQRIAHDVLTLPNLLAVFTYFGSIDLRSSDCQSAPAIEAATQQMVATASTANLPVILATLPPSAFCTNPAKANFGPSPTAADPYAGGFSPGPANGAEVQRAAFNQWVRSTAVALPGVSGIADLDKALADPAHPGFMFPQFNSGDNFHPNGLGYQAEAGAIPLSMLPPPPK